MAGIYIHIPFCSKACHYCNFHFSTSLHRKPELLQALTTEILQHPIPEGLVAEKHIDTIYFGGGTPSLLASDELEALLLLLHRRFAVAANAEITLEANPDDITDQRLQQWNQIGINRLSIGVQSFADADLYWMNRAHTASQSKQCLAMAKKHGFSNLSIDLIYGLPHMTLQHWQANIEEALSWQIPHLSCYALTVEEKTALHYFIQKGKVPPPNDDHQANHFLLLMQTLEQAGYEHYEISNFALPGHRSRHNSSYWEGVPYYGFGPSAHSFDGKNTRWWNVANNSFYITQMNAGLPAFQAETLSQAQRLNETIMTRLRMSEGLSLEAATKTLGGYPLGPADWDRVWKEVKQGIGKHWLLYENNTLRLSNTGRLYADHIAAGLFVS